jgi:hypothetical protein
VPVQIWPPTFDGNLGGLLISLSVIFFLLASVIAVLGGLTILVWLIVQTIA